MQQGYYIFYSFKVHLIFHRNNSRQLASVTMLLCSMMCMFMIQNDNIVINSSKMFVVLYITNIDFTFKTSGIYSHIAPGLIHFVIMGYKSVCSNKIVRNTQHLHFICLDII